MAEYLGNGIYRIGKAERIWSCRKDVMDGAVAEVEPGIPPANARFGWFKGAIPTPPSGGFYVVEFLDDQKVRVLAYVDMYGRAFTTETGFEQPPAQESDLCIANEGQYSIKGDIFVLNAESGLVKCASYERSGSGQNAKYTIKDSWYDFEGHGKRLHYYDLMTRAYLAFVYRPTLGKASIPFGIQDVYRTLVRNPLLPALVRVVEKEQQAEADALITAHPLIVKLRERLITANIPDLAAKEDAEDALYLIRTERYADTFFIGRSDPTFEVDEATIWEIEAAINLFSLSESVLQTLQSHGELATIEGCESFLMESFATQTTDLDLATPFPAGSPDGQWQVRSRISAGIEHAALPLRIDARFTLDLGAGIVNFDVRVPDAQMIEALFGQSTDEATATAKRYGMHVGLLLADIAFRASDRVNEVNLMARPIERDGRPSPALFAVAFDRELYHSTEAFEAARKGDPAPLYEQAEPLADNGAMMSQPLSTLIDRTETSLAEAAARQLGAKDDRDLQIFFDAETRTLAERLADAIAQAPSTSDAVAAVRAIQEEVAAKHESARMTESFTRLLKALAEGTIDPHEQNSTVDLFLEEDRCARAARQAKTLEEAGDIEKAVQVLKSALADFEGSGRFADTDTVVYRVFDSYASRLIYNLMKMGAITAPPGSTIHLDTGKETRLAPDGYFFCLHLLANDLCEQGHSDESIRVAEKAIRISPMGAQGYHAIALCQLVEGDLAGARTTLQTCLQMLILPDSIALSYYRLAYVLWKSGDPEAGLVCYIKALKTSQINAAACIAEIEELQKETGLPLPPSEDVDALLEAHAIPNAPTKAIRDAIEEGAIAALDEGLSDVACNLLSLVMRYHNDDALMNIIRSIDDSPAFQ